MISESLKQEVRMQSQIWITSDWHFFHKGINKATSTWDRSNPIRNFSSLDEMHDCIIDNINAVVQPKDVLWNLGDVIFGENQQLFSLRKRIKCRDIRLVLGNHDVKQIKEHRINDSGKRVPGNRLGSCFSDVRWFYWIKYLGQKIYLFHCPMHTWPGINHGFMHLYAHCHGNLPDRNLRCMDVGIDTNNYKPYLLDDIIERMLQITEDDYLKLIPDIKV